MNCREIMALGSLGQFIMGKKPTAAVADWEERGAIMTRKIHYATLFLTTALGGAASAWAQQPAKEPAPGGVSATQAGDTTGSNKVLPVDPSDIIVTARRRDERLLDVPVSITAVSGATLQTYQVSQVTDLAGFVPSLVASKAASGSSASVYLRGVGSTALSAGFDTSVSFVIDGLAMSRGREISLPQFDIQRVEVLKGPQALFFGKNTTGGLISVVSNSPTNKFEAGVTAGYGFEAQQKYVDGYISGPISDTLRARVAGRYSKSNGAFTNTAAASYSNYIPGQFRTRNRDRRGFAETLGLRGTVEWEPSTDVKFQLKGGLSRVKDGGPTDLIERVCGGGRTSPLPASFGSSFPASPNADCTVNGRSDSSAIPIQVAQTGYRYARDGKLYADFKSQFAVVTGNVKLDPFDVTSITGYYHFHQTDLNNVTGEAYPAGFSQLADYKQFSQELRFQSKFHGPLNILFGGFYAHGKFVFNTDAYIAPLPLDTVNNTYISFSRDDGFKSDSASVFGQATFDITPKLQLSAGGRYSHEARDSYQRSRQANSILSGVFPAGIVLNDRFRANNFSPEVSLRYKPDPDTTLYAAYKEGFKTGGYNISQTLTPATTLAQGRFGAEKAKGEEIGIHTLKLDRRLNFNFAIYRYVYSDLQVQFYDPQANTLIAGNAGKLKTQGVEADFNYRVPGIEGLSFRGAGAYNDAKFHNYIGQCYAGQVIAAGCNLNLVAGRFTAQNYEGRTSPKAPHFAGRLGTTLSVPITSSGISARFSGDASFTSKYNYSDALRPDAIQSGYTKFDASASIHGPGDRWSVSLIGRNLTNKLVIGAANDLPFTGGTGGGTTGPGVLADMSAFIDNPREIFLEFSLKF